VSQPASAPALEPHHTLLILDARARPSLSVCECCVASLGRLVDGVEDNPVEEFTVHVVEALDRVRQPKLGGENRLAQLLLHVLDVRGDPPRDELEFLVELGVLHPAHTTHDPCMD
jgi:hypothetical protein